MKPYGLIKGMVSANWGGGRRFLFFFGFYFGFLLAMLYCLRTDGGLLALCDHGNWPCLLDQYGQREYWVERPGWFLM